MQPPSTGAASLSTKVVDAIDQNYLFAEIASWQRLRADPVRDPDPTLSSMDQQLARLGDGDLRIVTSEQRNAMQAEIVGNKRGIGFVDFAVTMDPATGDRRSEDRPLEGLAAHASRCLCDRFSSSRRF